MKKIFLLLFLFFLSCNSDNHVKQNNLDNLSLKDSLSIYQRNDSKMVNFFDGSVSLSSIYLSPKLLNKILKELDKKNIKLKNILSEKINNDHINFIVSFYTPKNSWNDLDTINSIWNITLESNGKKMNSPKITLLKNTTDVLNSFFKKNSFSIHYILSFKKIDIKDSMKLTFSSIHLELKNIWEF